MNMKKKKQNNKEKYFKDYSLYVEIEGVFSKAINTMNDTIIDTNKKKEKKCIVWVNRINDFIFLSGLSRYL